MQDLYTECSLCPVKYYCRQTEDECEAYREYLHQIEKHKDHELDCNNCYVFGICRQTPDECKAYCEFFGW